MIYSVYSYDRREYEYYEAPGPGGTHAGAPPRPLAPSSGGVSPEGATWRLPLGAKKIGTGALPKGRIASSGFRLGGLGEIAEVPLPVVIGVAYLAWRLFR